MYLIVGLGNPGEQYTGTRHNLGFMVLQEFRKKKNSEEWHEEKKFKALISRGENFILVLPQTYMNNSGMAVTKTAGFYKIEPQNIVVVHDELDLQLGKIKIRNGGSAAGHRGVENIIEKLGTDKFARLRIGIGNQLAFLGEHKRVSFEADKFVMEKFGDNETSDVKHMIKQSIKAIQVILDKGLEKAQNQHN